jgi:hypothetical protein
MKRRSRFSQGRANRAAPVILFQAVERPKEIPSSKAEDGGGQATHYSIAFNARKTIGMEGRPFIFYVNSKEHF